MDAKTTLLPGCLLVSLVLLVPSGLFAATFSETANPLGSDTGLIAGKVVVRDVDRDDQVDIMVSSGNWGRNVKNEVGQTVSSGYYLYRVYDKTNDTAITGKIAVVR